MKHGPGYGSCNTESMSRVLKGYRQPVAAEYQKHQKHQKQHSLCIGAGCAARQLSCFSSTVFSFAAALAATLGVMHERTNSLAAHRARSITERTLKVTSHRLDCFTIDHLVLDVQKTGNEQHG